MYMESFQRARLGRQDQPLKPLAVRTLAEQQADLPDWRLDHLARMTDSTGHVPARHLHHPQLRGGVLHRRQRPRPAADRAPGGAGQGGPDDRARHDLRRVPAGGLRPEQGRFRNFLGFDRRWLEEVGSEDCHGRALWALGTCVGRSRRADCRSWAAAHFELALPAVLEMTSPRAWAFALLGIQEYLRRFSGDRMANQVRAELAARLIAYYERTATPDWPWFEEIVAYDNARLPQALIMTGRWAGSTSFLKSASRPWLACQEPDRPAGAFPGDRLQRLLETGREAGPVRPAADRGPRHDLCLPGGVRGDRRPALAERARRLLSGSWAATTWA